MIRLEKIGWSPVKGFKLQYVPSAYLTTHGLEWDREFFLFDGQGKVNLYEISSFLPVEAGYEADSDRLTFTYPDGQTVSGSAEPTGEVFVYNHVGLRDMNLRYVNSELDEAISERAGQEVRLARVTEPGQGVDVFAVSMVSFESVADLAVRAGKPGLEPGRFRSTFEISGVEPYEEETWTGRRMRVGGTVEIEVLTAIPRCVISTLNPNSGKRDHNVVRTLSKYREHVTLPPPMPEFAAAPMAVYANVLVPGRVEVGQELVFID